MKPPGEASILAELVQRAHAHPEDQLLQFGSLLSAHQYLPLYRLWRRHVPAGARVLDWGAGNGHFSYFLQRSGYRTEGYSLLDAPFLRWLAEPGGYAFTRGDAKEPVRLPYPDRSFDAVASIGVLEHVRETGGSEEASLREIGRILRPGGLFVCYHFPNRTSWIDWAARRAPGMHRHEYRFTRREIESLVAGAGLRLLHVERYGLLPRNSGARLPAALRMSSLLAKGWDALDRLLGVPFGALAQNYRFVAGKDGAAEASSGGRTERNAR